MIEHKRDNTLRNDKCKENRVLSSRLLKIKRLDHKSNLFFIAAIKHSLNISDSLMQIDSVPKSV